MATTQVAEAGKKKAQTHDRERAGVCVCVTMAGSLRDANGGNTNTD